MPTCRSVREVLHLDMGGTFASVSVHTNVQQCQMPTNVFLVWHVSPPEPELTRVFWCGQPPNRLRTV